MNILAFTSAVVGPVSSVVGIAELFENTPPLPTEISVFNNGPGPAAVLLISDMTAQITFETPGISLVLAGETVVLPASIAAPNLAAVAGPAGSLNAFALLGICAGY